MRRTRLLPVLAAALLLPVGLTALPSGLARAALPEEGVYAWVESLDRGDHYRLVTGTPRGEVRAVLAPQVYGRPAFSPDGSQVAYSAPVDDGSTGRYALFAVRVDGGDRRQLTAPRVGDFDPDWSPDGTSIVVSRDERGSFEPSCCVLWLIGLAGQGDRRLDEATSAKQPDFSPDGTQIAYATPEGIRAVTTAGGPTRLVAGGPLSWPAFAPDGGAVAAVRRDGPETGTIVLVPSAGGASVDTAAGQGGGLPEAPQWTDLRHLVHLNVRGQGEDGRTYAEVRRTTTDGETASVFITGLPLHYLSWTPGWRYGLPQPAARDIADACPPGTPEDGFADVPDGVHEPAVDCVVHWQIARGRAPGTYGPELRVTRAQMASFLARLVEVTGGELPPAARDHFDDDDGDVHEDAINRLAQAGIVNGTGPGTYSPYAPVSRAQMAALVVRTYDVRAAEGGLPPLPPGEDWYYDDQANVHRDRIDRATSAGFATGVGEGRYLPDEGVRRDQMGSFLARVLDRLVEDGLTTPPPTG